MGEAVGIGADAETVAAGVKKSNGRFMDLKIQNVMVQFRLTLGGGDGMSKVIARWSEMTLTLVRLLMVMPAVQTRSSVCLFFCVGKATCWVMLK